MLEAEFEVVAREELVKLLNSLQPDVIRVEKDKIEVPSGNARADLILNLRVENQPLQLVAEFKGRGEPSILAQAILAVKRFTTEKQAFAVPLVAAPYLGKTSRELCEKEGVNYFDLSGNYRIKLGNYFFQKTGEKNTALEKKELKNLFAPKASRIARAILENPRRSWTATELAKETATSVPLAFHAVNKLRDYRFLEKDASARVAPVKEKLGEMLDSWAKKYAYTENTIHAYYSLQKSPNALLNSIAETARKNKWNWAATMHAGATLVSPFVRSNETHVYIGKGAAKQWIESLQLAPTDAGANVFLLEPYDDGVFYKKQDIQGISVVCNIQLYLDLNSYPKRGKEQAEALREKTIRF